MYVSLGLLLVGGIAAGLQNHYFSFWWIWISLGLLVAAIGSFGESICYEPGRVQRRCARSHPACRSQMTQSMASVVKSARRS